MPRIITRVRARADASYEMDYHYPLRSRIYNALTDTEFDERHEADQPPGFVTSSIMPFGDFKEGDTRTLIIAAAERNLLKHVIKDFGADRELNLGELPLEIESARIKDTDVGGRKATGTIETRTGVLVKIPPERFEEYGIEDTVVDRDQPEFWRPHLGTGPFVDMIRRNLAWKRELFCEAPLAAADGGDRFDGPLFDSSTLMKTFSKPVTVTRSPDVKRTVVLSKHSFEYTVRTEEHRRLLNLALDCGIGARNHLGLGFLDITERGS